MVGQKPSLKTTNNCLRLECWGIVPNGDVYTAPERQSFSLKGFVFNHPNFEDGSDITTSSITSVTSQLGDAVLARLEGPAYAIEVFVHTSSGSKYMLGDPDPNYEKLYPNAMERILKNGLKS